MLRITLFACACCALMASNFVFGRGGNVDDPKAAISRSLDAFHKAAADADFDAYFARFAPDAVFLGTDATERWTLEEFKTYCKPHFDKGRGWSYTLVEGSRNITVAESKTVAWFDELLDNAKYGRCRGSGVLRKIGDDWRIAQYNLALMVPNDAAKDVVALIRAQEP
jgi:ketosteroid isomerase-like protein